jgi:hypothetical protein
MRDALSELQMKSRCFCRRVLAIMLLIGGLSPSPSPMRLLFFPLALWSAQQRELSLLVYLSPGAAITHVQQIGIETLQFKGFLKILLMKSLLDLKYFLEWSS